MADRIVRIGGASAAANDTSLGVTQFLSAEPPIDYMVFDLLAESVVGRMGRLKLADPNAGYVAGFIDRMIGPHLRAIHERGIRVIANAGGVNPAACGAALRKAIAAAGVPLTVAVVDGSDLSHVLPQLRDTPEMFTGATLGDALDRADPVLAFTAYLGALPIAKALAKAADIVITGRIVDSATALGALIHEFGWDLDDFDRMAAGTLVGHLIECGTQVTGGTFTDWRAVHDWANLGYPIAECRADGSAVITKPAGTGGLVSVGTVAEQLLYEVEDASAYLVPDVACDFSGVTLEQIAPDRVRVSGPKGRSRPSTYKTCLTYDYGWRAIYAIPIVGQEAAAKATYLGESLIARTSKMLRDRNWGEWTRTSVEAMGSESSFGPHGLGGGIREVVARFAVEHERREAVEMFMAEASASQMVVAGATMPLTSSVAMVQHLQSVLVDKAHATITMEYDGVTEEVPVPTDGAFDRASIVRTDVPQPQGEAGATVPLSKLAWVRSGDKGDLFNLAVIARDPRFVPWLAASMTEAKVGAWYAHLTTSGEAVPAARHYVPGLHALNFLIRESMGGGLAANIRFDSPGKGNGQMILDFPVAVPHALAAELG
ncbi:acyclic terpene utilization AtuA family protein [Sphingomonas montanisoli]|nr:acyclic terpene utilization AtuA family protein [Sphingomonas montanisoli]